MCGIVGSFRPGAAGSAPDVVARMRDRMSHRGPDGLGIWTTQDHSCTFGHRRLSIIDVSVNANQPMVNDDATVALVFNGEIYNHADIRKELEALGKYSWHTDHSDTEMMLHAYEEWGLDCVKRFYGMFAFAVYDGRDPGRPAVPGGAGHQGPRGRQGTNAPPEPVDRQANGVGRAVGRPAGGGRRFVVDRRAHGRVGAPAGHDVHDRIRRQGELHRVSVRPP